MGINNSFYFSHDFNARNDPKLQKVLMKLGQEGKGVFWDVIEILYEQDGYFLLTELESMAFAIRVDVKVLNSLVNDFDLFRTDEVSFWSESVLIRLNIRKEKSEKARNSVNKRWIKKHDDTNVQKTDTNELLFELEGNTIKERKEKERKEKKINIVFEIFWDLYDKKVGKKLDVKTCWENLTDDIRSKIIQYIPKYKLDQPDKQFRTHPEKFLKKEGWEDELNKPKEQNQVDNGIKHKFGGSQPGVVNHGL